MRGRRPVARVAPRRSTPVAARSAPRAPVAALVAALATALVAALATAPVAALATAAAGCGRAAPASEAAAWVNRAAGAHRRADQAAARGAFDEARAARRGLAEGPAAPGVAAADRRAVRMDAYSRLAELELRAGHAAAAATWADAGLALGPGRDVFTANLYLARGRALEARGVDREAAASYHRALVVSESLLGAALHPEAGVGP
jgi:hypothetical protein